MDRGITRLTALQFAPEYANPAANIERLSQMIDGLSTDLLVLPELASTGYFFTERDVLLELAEDPSAGTFTGWMRDRAAGLDAVVVGGFAERDTAGRLYNSAMVALPSGDARVYRKVHLFYKEKLVFEPGDTGFFVVHHQGIAIGTMICYDWRFPEAMRVLALAGAEVVAHPSNLVAARELWAPTMRTRSFENKLVSVTANRNGSETLGEETLEFTGGSQIASYNGSVLAETGPGDQCIITAEVDLARTRSKRINPYNDIFADRRPEWY